MAKREYWLRFPVRQLPLPQEVDRLFDEMIYRPWKSNRMKAEEWHPQVDLYDDSTTFMLEADLPGVSAQEVSVTIEGEDLVLQGKRSFTQRHEEGNFCYHERRCGHFMRRLRLPTSIDQNHIRVEFHDGVLRVTLPKLRRAGKL